MPAYAHYYAGLSYYQAERIDLMAAFFESFLKLAPDAPERAQVESIMRTIRGRRYGTCAVQAGGEALQLLLAPVSCLLTALVPRTPAGVRGAAPSSP